MQLALLALFLVVAVLLVVRAANRERTDYRRFKKLKTTRERQRVFARWLRESILINGGITVAVLLASWNMIGPASRSALTSWPLNWFHEYLSGGLGVAFSIGISIVAAVLLVVPMFVLRRQVSELPAIGDVGALLPRTRGELKYGVGLSVNAGVIEELMFRLGMPALLFGITGNGLLSFVIASVLFGLLHLYQKVWGVLGATILGLMFSAVYLLTGSIWAVIVVHAVIDLRSLVLLPLVVQNVWNKLTDPPEQTPSV